MVWEIVMGAIKITIVITLLVLLWQLFSFVFPYVIFFLFLVAAIILILWISEQNTPDRHREKMKRKEAKERYRTEAAAVAHEKQAVGEGFAQLEQVRSALFSTVADADLAVRFYHAKDPLVHFYNRLEWHFTKSDIYELVEEGQRDLTDDVQSGSVQITSIFAHVRKLASVQSSLQRRYRQLDAEDRRNSDATIIRLKVAEFNLNSTIVGLENIMEIRAEGTILEEYYEKLKWLLNKKRTRLLLERVGNVMKQTESFSLSDSLEITETILELETLDDGLWEVMPRKRLPAVG